MAKSPLKRSLSMVAPCPPCFASPYFAPQRPRRTAPTCGPTWCRKAGKSLWFLMVFGWNTWGPNPMNQHMLGEAVSPRRLAQNISGCLGYHEKDIRKDRWKTWKKYKQISYKYSTVFVYTYICVQLLSYYYISWNICLVDRHRKIHQEPRSRPFGRTALVEKARDQQLLDPNCAAKWWISNLSTSDFLNSTRMFVGSCPKKNIETRPFEMVSDPNNNGQVFEAWWCHKTTRI